MDKCPRCGCPSFTSMQSAATGRWAAQCDACTYAFWLDREDEDDSL